MEIPRFFIFNWVGHTADGLTEKTMYISMMVAGGGGEGSDQRKGGCMVLVLTRGGDPCHQIENVISTSILLIINMRIKQEGNSPVELASSVSDKHAVHQEVIS